MYTAAEVNSRYSEYAHNGGPLPDDAEYVCGDFESSWQWYVHVLFKKGDTYYAVDGGGCSCDEGSWELREFSNLEDALNFFPEWDKKEMREQLLDGVQEGR